MPDTLSGTLGETTVTVNVRPCRFDRGVYVLLAGSNGRLIDGLFTRMEARRLARMLLAAARRSEEAQDV